MNTVADIAIVDAALKALVALLPEPSSVPASRRPILLAAARAVQNYLSDRAGAIAAFQRIEDIRDENERQTGLLLPDGLTWETLFTYGELAKDLVAKRDAKVNPADYIHMGFFDERLFQDEAMRRFRATHVDHGRYTLASVPAMLDLLRRCANDPRVIDIRWIAYMLATAMWETSHVVSVPNPNGRGTRKISEWASPIEESGKGRINAKDIKGYYLPVKVAASADGGAVVTEQDGQIFTVSRNGTISASSGATHGANAFTAAKPAYTQASGSELRYYGRGYCQLTWWDNYAKTGVEIGQGLDLLFHPERALEPAVAFEVMVHGMVYGSGFANGLRLQMFLTGGLSNYVGARAMVNGTNEAREIAAVAVVFEKALLAARL